MKRILCVVLVSSLLLLTLAAGVSSPPLTSTLSRQHARVLGRKGRGLGQVGNHSQHEGKRMQNSEVSLKIRPMKLFDYSSNYLRRDGILVFRKWSWR
jgi:hypothetical protein